MTLGKTLHSHSINKKDLIMLKLSKLEILSLSLIALNSFVITVVAIFYSMVKKDEDILFTPHFNGENKKTQMQKAIEKIIIRVAIYENNAYWVVNNTVYKATVDDHGQIDDTDAITVNVFDLSEKEVDNLLAIIDSIS
jgi:hypothetical protein